VPERESPFTPKRKRTMKDTETINKTSKATIANVEPSLAALLKEFTYQSYELRCSSNASDKLYIRLRRETPSVHLRVA